MLRAATRVLIVGLALALGVGAFTVGPFSPGVGSPRVSLPATVETVTLPPTAVPTTPPVPTLDLASAPPIPIITGDYFAPGTKIVWYDVTGATPYEIFSSVTAVGPSSAWVGARAEGLTTDATAYRFHYLTRASVCRIIVTAHPAIVDHFTVTLPRWTPPLGVDPATVGYWASELARIATHERHHVTIDVAATKQANSVLTSSTCANAETRLNTVWAAEARANCQFDLDAYGRAAGLTLKECLAQRG